MSARVKRILIVDDEPDHRMILSCLFSHMWSLEVALLEAENGREAVSLAQQWHPHLILMDVRMPEMNGYEAALQIRTLENLQAAGIKTIRPIPHRIQMIAVTAFVSEKERSHALEVGYDGWIGKPYRFESLYQKVTEHLSRVDSPLDCSVFQAAESA